MAEPTTSEEAESSRRDWLLDLRCRLLALAAAFTGEDLEGSFMLPEKSFLRRVSASAASAASAALTLEAGAVRLPSKAAAAGPPPPFSSSSDGERAWPCCARDDSTGLGLCEWASADVEKWSCSAAPPAVSAWTARSNLNRRGMRARRKQSCANCTAEGRRRRGCEGCALCSARGELAAVCAWDGRGKGKAPSCCSSSSSSSESSDDRPPYTEREGGVAEAAWRWEEWDACAWGACCCCCCGDSACMCGDEAEGGPRCRGGGECIRAPLPPREKAAAGDARDAVLSVGAPAGSAATVCWSRMLHGGCPSISMRTSACSAGHWLRSCAHSAPSTATSVFSLVSSGPVSPSTLLCAGARRRQCTHLKRNTKRT